MNDAEVKQNFQFPISKTNVIKTVGHSFNSMRMYAAHWLQKWGGYIFQQRQKGGGVEESAVDFMKVEMLKLGGGGGINLERVTQTASVDYIKWRRGDLKLYLHKGEV